MRTRDWVATAMLLSMGAFGCGEGSEAEGQNEGDEQVGAATLSLTRAPTDAQCVRITVAGAARTLTRLLPLTSGQSTVFRLEGLPVGLAAFTGEAFDAPCNGVFVNSVRSWYSEPVQAHVKVINVAHVVLEMIRNGRSQVTVDFDESNNPTTEDPASELPGVTSSQTAYLVPVASGVQIKPILTVGDAAGLKPDGLTPYRFVGIPDGLGAFDNGDGTFTLLSNHELGETNGILRDHGAAGAFVSKWVVRKSDLAVLSGSDLIKRVALWNPVLGAYGAPVLGEAFTRFCSADLADASAFYDAVSGLGTEERLFLNGEEAGAGGRGFAHAMDGTSYELPRLGKFSFENAVAAPGTGQRTVVIGLDDEGGGQLHIYVGDKTSTGSVIDRAGLTNGSLFVVSVPGFADEPNVGGIPTSRFEAAELGNVENWTGAQLEATSDAIGGTGFQRPEDGAWDPINPNDFYFVTTASFTTNSRLWRLRFEDSANPELGGSIEMLLDGSEGQRMMDQIAIDARGHVLIQEDVGGNDHLGRILRYDLATDVLTTVATHDANRFAPGGAGFLTRDEEASGIIDASSILGDGWFLSDTQAHYGLAAELVQGGQFFAIYDPGSL
jgi:hypothetical protein